MVRNKANRSETLDLFRRGNVGLIRLLMIINNAGPDGKISTVKLFEQFGSTGYGQTLLKRAEKAGLIRREDGEEPGPGQFSYKFNIITEKGKKLLNQLK